MMKWLVIGIGGLTGLVAVVVVVGMLLPKDHVASSTVRVAQPPDSVFAVVRNFAGYAGWWPNVRSMERITDHEREAWRQVDRTNAPMLMEVIVDEPPARLVTHILDDGMPFGGTWTYELSPAAGGTRITITEDGKVYNPIFRFVSRFVMGHHGTMDVAPSCWGLPLCSVPRDEDSAGPSSLARPRASSPGPATVPCAAAADVRSVTV